MEGNLDNRINEAVKVGICSALGEVFGPWFNEKLVEAPIMQALQSMQKESGYESKQQGEEANGVIPQETPPQKQEVKADEASDEEQQQSPQEEANGEVVAVEVVKQDETQEIAGEKKIEQDDAGEKKIGQDDADEKKRKLEGQESEEENASKKKKSKKDKSKDKDADTKSEKKKDKKKDKKKK